MLDKQANYFEQKLSPTQTGIAIKVSVQVSLLNGNHFYNGVHMRTFASFPKIYLYRRLRRFKKEGGPSAGSSFEQISMQRLTGVPSPISGGTGWVWLVKLAFYVGGKHHKCLQYLSTPPPPSLAATANQLLRTI